MVLKDCLRLLMLIVKDQKIKKQTEQSQRQVKSIDALPDDILLDIFHFYMIFFSNYRGKMAIEAWQLLVHVCRRWRSVVFGSPRGLNLQLYCTPRTPVKETLDVWPALPLLVNGCIAPSSPDNTIAALGQRDRVCQVNLPLEHRNLEEILAAMQVSFPELTDLRLSSYVSIDAPYNPIGIPESLLGGSAPRLQTFTLHNTPFSGLPKLLLSATHLVEPKLTKIPRSGYISPEAMADLFSVLSRLRILFLEYKPPILNRESRSPLPSKQSILPSLVEFRFTGFTGYLEALVTHLDAPQLNEMHISFINADNFDCSRLAQFIDRTSTLRAHDKARLQFDIWNAKVALLARSSTLRIETESSLEAFISRLCDSFLHPLSTVEDLYIEHFHFTGRFPRQNILWLQLLLPFTAVKNLYLPKELAPSIVVALQEPVDGSITVLPSLQNIFMKELEASGPFQEDIGRFVAARRLSGHHITISDWDKKHDMGSM